MSLRIMLVDDSEADRLYTRIVLERSGAARQVLEYETASAALADLAQSRVAVDLILLDINMPGMDGFEFLDAYQLLSDPASSAGLASPKAVVMLTSSPDLTDRQRALAYPCVKGYVTKPLSLEAARDLQRHAPVLAAKKP